MAGPPRDAIDAFVAITGASEALALQKLEEHYGDLNLAVNAYLNDQESAESPDPFEVQNFHNDAHGPHDFYPEDAPYGDSPVARWPEAFSFIRQRLQSIFGGGGFIGYRRNEPGVSHPRNVREIPIEFKDESNLLGVPRIEDVTGRVTEYHPTIQGNVTCDDVDDIPDSLLAMNERTCAGFNLNHPEPSAPRMDFVIDEDGEDDLMKAAIEASKREAMAHTRNEDIFNLEDAELEHAISLSLKVAEERGHREHGREMWQTGSCSSDRAATERSRSDEEDAEQLKEQDQSRHQYKETLGSHTFAYDSGNPVNGISSSSAMHDNYDYYNGKESLDEKMERQLPPEPSCDAENGIVLLVKMPDGNRHGRRFLKSDKLKLLVDFIDIGGFAQHRSYRLVRPFPRRVFGEAEHEMTFSELGLTEKQEVLFLESI